jgi:hypothetical protein
MFLTFILAIKAANLMLGLLNATPLGMLVKSSLFQGDAAKSTSAKA